MSVVFVILALVAFAPAVDEPTADEPPPPEGAGGAEYASPEPETITVRRLYLDAMMPTETSSELRLRVPSAEPARLGDGQEREEGSVHARWTLGPTRSGRRELEVVLWDGRAYRRAVPDADRNDPRVMASLIGNLLSDLETRFVEPDAVGVEVVVPESADPDPEDEPEQIEAEPERRAPARAEPPAKPERAGGRIDLGVAPVLALAPPRHGDAFSGTRVHLKGGYVWPKGGTLAVAIGVASRSFALDHRLVRMRTFAGGGYTWVGQEMEVTLLAGGFADPWWLLRGSSSAELSVDGDTREPGPVVGGLLSLHARRWWGRPGTSRVQLGAFAELGGGAVLDSPSTVAGLSNAEGAMTRLGGVELVFGVELGALIRRAKRSDARTPR